MAGIDSQWVRKQFPFFTSSSKEYIYFDNSSATLKLQSVVDIVNQYNIDHPTNLHSHGYFLGQKTVSLVNDSRQKIAKFINCKPQEIIFTYNTTSGLDMAAKFVSEKLEPGSTILVSPYAHGSNLLPWVEISRQKNLKIKVIKPNKDNLITKKEILASVDDSVKAIAIEHISNSLTYQTGIEEAAPFLKAKGIFIIVDAAQSILHTKTDVKKLHADFLAFSGYKMFSTTGIGVLYINPDIINTFCPLLPGGFQFKKVSVTKKSVTYKNNFLRHEPSTSNVEGILALAKAVDFIKKVGIKNIHNYEKSLVKYALNQLKTCKQIKVFNNHHSHCNLIIAPQEGKVDQLLDHLANHKICVKIGDFGAPLLKKITKQTRLARISFSLYNTKSEIDYLIKVLKLY